MELLGLPLPLLTSDARLSRVTFMSTIYCVCWLVPGALGCLQSEKDLSPALQRVFISEKEVGRGQVDRCAAQLRAALAVGLLICQVDVITDRTP